MWVKPISYAVVAVLFSFGGAASANSITSLYGGFGLGHAFTNDFSFNSYP